MKTKIPTHADIKRWLANACNNEEFPHLKDEQDWCPSCNVRRLAQEVLRLCSMAKDLRTSLTCLGNRLDEISENPTYLSAFALASEHKQPYVGPAWDELLEGAKYLLTRIELPEKRNE